MTTMTVTTFKSIGSNKIAFSPYYDKEKNPIHEFDFINYEVELDYAHLLLQDNCILSRPLIQTTYKIERNKEKLEHLYNHNCNYIVVDFDEIKDEDSSEIIINFFRNNTFSINLFNSTSYGIENYNMKAFILVNFETNVRNVNATLEYLSSVLKGFCKIDFSSNRNANYQSGYYIVQQLLLKKDGALTFDVVKSFIKKEVDKEEIEITSKEQVIWFLKQFKEKYRAKFKPNPNSNGTYQVSIPQEVTKFGYYWSANIPWLLQHPKGRDKNISVLKDFYKSYEGKLFLKEQNNKKLKSMFTTENPNIFQASKYFSIGEEEKVLIENFLKTDNSILTVKGAMATGKSNLILELMKHKSNRILFITMRKSLSYDIMEKYNIKHYIEHLNKSDNSRYMPGDSLVIQVNSLYKVDINNFDLIIIDEFESLCIYTQSNISAPNFPIQNIKMLRTMFEKKSIMILDAFLNKLSIDLYFKDKTKFSIINTYRDDSLVTIYSNYKTMIDNLINCSKSKNQDEIITASFTTLNELETVKNILREHNIRVVVINAETADETKKMIYKIFTERHHESYDVVLFSPTITVGLSILNNVKHHFHYDIGMSVDPVSSIQMTKRSRLAENIHIYVDGVYKGNLIFDYERLIERFKENIKEYMKTNVYSIYYNMDTDELSEIGKFSLKFLSHVNFYNSNHKDTFLFLCEEQFKYISYNDEISDSYNFDERLAELRRDKAEYLVHLLDDVDTTTLYEYIDIACIEELEKKPKLSKEEEQKLILSELKKEFNCLNNEDILNMAKQHLKSASYISKIKYFMLFITKSQEEISTYLSEIIISSSKVNYINTKDFAQTLKQMMQIQPHIKLRDKYTMQEIISINNKNMISIKFESFLGKLGYIKKGNMYVIDKNIYKYSHDIIKGV